MYGHMQTCVQQGTEAVYTVSVPPKHMSSNTQVEFLAENKSTCTQFDNRMCLGNFQLWYRNVPLPVIGLIHTSANLLSQYISFSDTDECRKLAR